MQCFIAAMVHMIPNDFLHKCFTDLAFKTEWLHSHSPPNHKKYSIVYLFFSFFNTKIS